MSIVFLNGEFVPEERAVVSVFDRSFRYGDGLFEAALVVNGKIFRRDQHWQRLEQSAKFFQLKLPCSTDEMSIAAHELLKRNALREAVLRLQVSRGCGPRGYAPAGNEKPVVVMSAHPAPPRTQALWKLTVCPLRVASGDVLSQHKTCNRLLQVVAATHAHEHGADESLIVNTDGFINEGSTSNVFWVHDGMVCTPPIDLGVLPGVTRAVVRELCGELKIRFEERTIRPEELPSCEGVFLSFTSRGIVEAGFLDGRPLKQSMVTGELRDAFNTLLARECPPD